MYWYAVVVTRQQSKNSQNYECMGGQLVQYEHFLNKIVVKESSQWYQAPQKPFIGFNT